MIPEEVRCKLIDFAAWFESEADDASHSCGNWDGGDPRTCDKCIWLKAHVDMAAIIDALDSLPQAPEPDWSQAPEWAQWWVVTSSGRGYWYEEMPKVNYALHLWVVHDGNYDWDGVTKELPLGIDWRTTLRQRPG